MSSLTDYIAKLQDTKTCQAGLISFQEYSFQSWMFGLAKRLPPLPNADEDRHVIVAEIRGNQPNILTVLKEPGYTFPATTKDVDKLLFIFVEMRPDKLFIKSPLNGYRLGDGYQISADFVITYQVEDARSFWKGSRDPLSDLEIFITNAARTFFLGHSSASLIGCPADFKQALEQHIGSTDIGIVKSNLEESIKNSTCTVDGINLRAVIADVHIGDSLRDHLKGIHDKIYEGGGVAERYKIDQLIDRDRTFVPYNLRKVIYALDIGLVENFYTMKWSEAMRMVTERLAERKEKYMKSVEEKELMKMQKLKNAAESFELDEMDVTELKSKIANKLLSMADNTTDSHTFSDAEYLKIIIPPSSGRQLESDAKESELIEDE